MGWLELMQEHIWLEDIDYKIFKSNLLFIYININIH